MRHEFRHESPLYQGGIKTLNQFKSWLAYNVRSYHLHLQPEKGILHLYVPKHDFANVAETFLLKKADFAEEVRGRIMLHKLNLWARLQRLWWGV